MLLSHRGPGGHWVPSFGEGWAGARWHPGDRRSQLRMAVARTRDLPVFSGRVVALGQVRAPSRAAPSLTPVGGHRSQKGGAVPVPQTPRPPGPTPSAA